VKQFTSTAQAEAYDRWYASPWGRWVGQRERDAVAALVPPVAGLRLLEGGCGTGYFTEPLAAAGASLVGLDRSAAMLTLAREKLHQHRRTVRWVQGDLCRLPFPAASFDGVISLLALDFIADRQAALEESARVLRPGGFVLLAVLNRSSLWTLKRRLWARFKSSGWRQVDFLSAGDLTRLLDQTGVFQDYQWARAVYAPPWRYPGMVKLAPWWEKLGARWLPKMAAFLAVAACKKK